MKIMSDVSGMKGFIDSECNYELLILAYQQFTRQLKMKVIRSIEIIVV